VPDDPHIRSESPGLTWSAHRRVELVTPDLRPVP
jgi:hypothetical protein